MPRRADHDGGARRGRRRGPAYSVLRSERQGAPACCRTGARGSAVPVLAVRPRSRPSADARSRHRRAGFIGSHFVKRLAAARRRGRRARQADLLRQPGEPRRASSDEFVEGDICDPAAVAAAAAGCEAVVNFAAETHVDRSILGAGGVHRDRRARHYVLLDWARENGHAARAGLDRRGLRRHRPRAPRRARATRCSPSSPYAASKAGGDLQVLAYVRTYGVDASHHARLEHLRAEPVPGEDHPALRDQRARRRAAAALRRRPPDARLASRRGPLRRDRARAAAGRERARSTTSAAARRVENRELTRSILELTGTRRDARSATSRTGPATTGATRSIARSCAASAGRRSARSPTASQRRSPGTATTATGGSRSSRATTARTTRSSTQSGSASSARRA